MTKPYWIHGRWAATIQATVKADRLRGWHNRVTLGERFLRENRLWQPASVTMPDVAYKDPDRQRIFQAKWQKQRRDAWIQAHGPCACGSWTNLRLDSMDGQPKTETAVWSRSPQRMAKELARYRVVCEDCFKRATLPVHRHGTTTMYRDGCRCDACRHASTAYRLELRRRTGRR